MTAAILAQNPDSSALRRSSARRWNPAAMSTMRARLTAASGVSQGTMPVAIGSTRPAAPSTSVNPMNTTSGRGRSENPVQRSKPRPMSFGAAAQFDLRLPDLAAVPRETIGSVLVGYFLDRWERDDSLQALLRAAVSNQVAVARLRAIFATQVMPAVAPLCPDRATAATRVGLVATQTLGMALCRYVLRLPPVVSLDRAAVIRWLAPTIQRYLTAGP